MRNKKIKKYVENYFRCSQTTNSGLKQNLPTNSTFIQEMKPMHIFNSSSQGGQKEPSYNNKIMNIVLK